MMTREEAKNKWCPYKYPYPMPCSVGDSEEDKAYYEKVKLTALCQAENCPKWRDFYCFNRDLHCCIHRSKSNDEPCENEEKCLSCEKQFGYCGG